MSDLPSYYIISYVISFLAQLTVLIACIVVLVKQRSLAAVLMLVGMTLHIAFNVIGLFMNTLAARKSPEAYLETQGIFSTLNTLSYWLFGIGLLLLAIKMVFRKRTDTPEPN